MKRTLVQDARGFTLIEVMIAMALVALMVVAGVVGVRSLAKSDLRSTATRMAGAIRYLFDRASTTGRVHRLVLDFETGKYWAEVTDDAFILGAGKETEDTRKREAEKIAKEEEAQRIADEKDAFYGNQIPSRYLPKPFVPKRAKFDAFREMAVKPITLRSSVMFADIYTPRLALPLTEGKGYLYFFPMGMTEAAVIHLSDKKAETFYTLIVHPLTGRVSVKNSFVAANLTDHPGDGAGHRLAHRDRQCARHQPRAHDHGGDVSGPDQAFDDGAESARIRLCGAGRGGQRQLWRGGLPEFPLVHQRRAHRAAGGFDAEGAAGSQHGDAVQQSHGNAVWLHGRLHVHPDGADSPWSAGIGPEDDGSGELERGWQARAVDRGRRILHRSISAGIRGLAVGGRRKRSSVGQRRAAQRPEASPECGWGENEMKLPGSRNANRGFTLVEIMLALALMAFVTSLVWGTFAQTERIKKRME
jgi:general secretion pathway protein H